MTGPRRWSTLPAFGFALALLGAEAVGVLLLWQGRPSMWLLLHLAAVATAALAWRRPQRLDASRATLRMTSLLIPFLGPVAAAAAVAILAVQLTFPTPDPDSAMWYEHLFPNLAADPITEQMDAISRRHTGDDAAGEVESFYDVLQWGTLPEQEHVLSLISRSFRPEFAPVLRQALASDDLGLRAQAAAGLSLLEARASAHLTELQAAWRQAAFGDTRDDAAIALARALSNAAHSGLYDEMRTTEIRRETVSLLAPMFAARPGDPALGAMLGRTLLQLEEFDDAVVTLETAIDAGQQNEAAFAWLVEGLYRQRSFVRLAALLDRHREQARVLIQQDSALAPALRLWGAAA